MRRVVGLSRAKLETREGVMEGLARNGIRAAVKSVSLGGLVTAAGAPSISTTAASTGAVATLTPIELSVATDTWSTYVDAALYPFLVETYMTAAEQTWGVVNDVLHVSTPKIIPLTAEDYLRAAVNRLKNVGNVLWSSIRDSLAQGYEAGESTHQLAARIRSLAKDIGEARALMIARTEVISAANAASLTQVQLGGFSDVECQKQWLATEDERTRATHRLADGEIVGLSEAFSVGGEYLQFPGDPTGRADNVINCRCTIEFIFTGEVEVDDGDVVVATSGPDPDWDESEHPRNKKGEFTKKGLGVLSSIGSLIEAAKNGSTGPVLIGVDANAGKRVNKSGSGYTVQKLIAGKWMNISEKLTLEQLKGKLHQGNWADPKAGAVKATTPILTPVGGLTVTPNFGKMSSTQIDTWYKGISQNEWDATAPNIKDKIQKHANLFYDAEGNTGPKNKIKMLDAGKGDDSTVSTQIDNTALIHHVTTAKPGPVAVNPGLGNKIVKTDKQYYEQHNENGFWQLVKSGLTKKQLIEKLNEGGWQIPPPDLGTPSPVTPLPPSPPPPALKSAVKKVKATPLHINTNVIYKQKYADGAVVAVKSDSTGEWRLIWSESKKKFVLYKTDGAMWVPKDEYGKGDAYKKFSKETGWLTPDSTLPTVTAAPVAATTVIYSAGDFQNATWTEKVGWLGAAGPAELNVFSLHGLDKLEQQVHEMFIAGDLTEPEYQDAIDKISNAKLVKTGGNPATVGIKSLDDVGWDPKNATNAVDFNTWFIGNIAGKKDVWDQLSKNDKSLIEAAAFNATMFGYDAASNQINEWTLGSGFDENIFVDHISGFSKGDFASWIGPNLSQDLWNKLKPSTQQLISDKADSLLSAYGAGAIYQVKSLKANAPTSFTGISSPLPTKTITVDDSDVSGPNGSSPAFDANGDQVAWVQYASDGSSAFIYSYDPVTGGNKTYAGSVDFNANELLEDKIQAFIDQGAIKITTAPNATSPPPPPSFATPSTPPPHGYNQHVIANQVVKFVGDIGQPKTGEKNFKSVSTTEMAKIQNDMLLLSDKKKWTTDEKAAVGFYGTSTGYQSMNAVLRNDEKRLNLFTEPQLSSAVQSAALVQSAMTPLTESLELHRGTGAQQFGFNTKTVSTSKLKKLQGTTLVDRGFVSTSVVPPTAISYDYAKKPIKVIINAPQGTPAVYVDSTKPGHNENELLIGAGSSYFVDEVREATPADKALYGDHTEQVVTMTIVPATKVGPKDITGATTPSKSATVTTGAPPSLTPVASPAVAPPPTLKSTPTLGGPPGGAPIKLNTNVIHKLSYTHGAVVAVKKAPDKDGNLYRLVWNGSQKKFMLQLQTTSGTWLSAVNLSQFKFTKKDAYNKFKDDTDWVTPSPGMTAMGSSGFGPNVSNTASPTSTANLPLTPTSSSSPSALPTSIPAPINAPNSETFVPTTPTSTVVPLDAASIQALHGDVPVGVTAPMQRKLFDDFKKNSTQGFIVLNSMPETQFKALKETLDKWNATGSGVSNPLNLLQLLKIIDQESTNKANAVAVQKGEAGNLTNSQLYEKKIVDWLKTPSGALTATKINSGVKDSSSVTDKLATFPDPHTIGTPSTKVTKFINLNHSSATALQNEMFAASGEWSSTQKSAIHSYTGSGYTHINATLRQAGYVYANLSESDKLSALERAANIQSAMKPLTKSIVTYRGTGPEFLPGLSSSASFNDIKQYEGKVFIDKGFSSSSIKKTSAFNQKVKLTIDIPEGAPAMYVENHTSTGGEQELLLAAGTKYYIRSVNKNDSTTEVHLAVVP